MERGLYVTETGLNVADYLVQWLAAHKNAIRPTTYDSYKIMVNKHIIPHIGKIPLQKLPQSMISDMYADLLGTGLSPTTVLYVHRTLRKALNDAVRDAILSKNPLSTFSSPKKADFAPVILNKNEILDLLSAVMGTDLELVVVLAAMLGLRRGDG